MFIKKTQEGTCKVNFQAFVPRCGWIFSSPQEAGSRTASLKRSNQVKGLRHSRSVSYSWFSSNEALQYPQVNSAIAHQPTWMWLISVFCLCAKYLYIHVKKTSKNRHLHDIHWSDAHAYIVGTGVSEAVNACCLCRLSHWTHQWKSFLSQRM